MLHADKLINGVCWYYAQQLFSICCEVPFFVSASITWAVFVLLRNQHSVFHVGISAPWNESRSRAQITRQSLDVILPARVIASFSRCSGASRNDAIPSRLKNVICRALSVSSNARVALNRLVHRCPRSIGLFLKKESKGCVIAWVPVAGRGAFSVAPYHSFAIFGGSGADCNSHRAVEINGLKIPDFNRGGFGGWLYNSAATSGKEKQQSEYSDLHGFHGHRL